jgi:eukaryotic-like serine/threonine-protein kinase
VNRFFMVEFASLRDRVLAGRYRLEERLGAGGMGSIWRAHHLVLAAPVAVKLIDRDVHLDADTIARFMREAQAAATLRSPHVVQILDYGMDDKLPFIVMELLDGENLAQRLKRVQRLGALDTARIVTEIGRAVARAHEAGIVHRDLKPENVFLVRNEDEEVAKVLDFGVAKVEPGALGGEGSHTRTGSILGTPFYMSPEQAQGNKAVDYRSDLWSLGVIAFECLTGSRPFYSDGLGDLVLQICIRDIPVPSARGPVPLGFDAWFARAVSREPELRFQSAREMTEALRDALGLEPRDTSPTGPEVLVSSPNGLGTPPAGAEESRASGTRTFSTDSPSSIRLAGTPSADADMDGAAVPASIDPASFTGAGDEGYRRPIAWRLFGVALTALVIGIAGGLWLLRQSAPARPNLRSEQVTQRSLGQEPLAQPPPASTAISEPAASAPATAEPALSASSAPAVPTEASARPVASAAPRPSAEPAALPKPATAPTSPMPPAASADAGWTKPAWAIPDEEPTRAREAPADPYPAEPEH